MKHHLWNMLANLKNGLRSNKSFILQRKKKIFLNVLNVLWDEGFILGYKDFNSKNNILIIFLKYNNNTPCIQHIKLISKPSKKIYYSTETLWKIESSTGLIILTTNKGILTINDCRRLSAGGEPLFHIK